VGDAIPGGAAFSLALPLNAQWGVKLPGQLALASPYAESVSPTVWNSYVHGSSHPDLRNPFKFQAWLAPQARLILHVNSVSSGAIVNVRVDGKDIFTKSLPNKDGQWQVNHEYDQDLSIDLPEGKHLVEIRNTGQDWFYLDWVRVENALPSSYSPDWSPSPMAIGVKAGEQGLIYVVNPVMVYPAKATNASVSALVDGRVVISNWESKDRCQAFFYDPKTASGLGKAEVTATNGVLTLTLPEFQEDLFIRIDRLPTLHSPRLTPGNALNFIEFHIASEPESVVRLKSSTNMTDWQDWRLITNTTGDDIYLDALLDNQRFYRATPVAP
jgi:hypothetical protein